MVQRAIHGRVSLGDLALFYQAYNQGFGLFANAAGYSGEGERCFRREAERHSGTKVNSSRSEATLAW
jgi:hypothetical protein